VEKETMMSTLDTDPHPMAVMWRRQPLTAGVGREVAVMAAGGPTEGEGDRRIQPSDSARGPSRPTSVALSSDVRDLVASSSTSSVSDINNGQRSRRKATFAAVAKTAAVSSTLQHQLSADLEDFRAPTPLPQLPPTPPAHQELSESPMFQWKLSSPPPRRVFPPPTFSRPGSPAQRHGYAGVLLVTMISGGSSSLFRVFLF